MSKYVTCPKCGGNPEVDSEGKYYTCFYCCDEGAVLASSIEVEVEPKESRILKSWNVDACNEWCDGGSWFYTVKSKLEPTREELAMAGIHARSCRCEHDCCGHRFFWDPKVVRRNKRREWLVVMRYAFNN